MAAQTNGIVPIAPLGDGPVVLLIDAGAAFGATLRHMLSTERDVSFHHCSEGEQAVDLATRLRPTVILQDLVVSGVDGLELVAAYRASEGIKQVPIVLLSSTDNPGTKAAAFERGADDYMVKPPHKAELVARIRYHSRSYRLMLREHAMVEAEKRRLIAERQAEALRARNTLIFALAKLAESRDMETGEHLERIAAYCRVLGEQLRVARPELDDVWIRNLQLASSLHDIGKVGIPDAVLLKPERLTPEERVVIERHPVIGARALDAILERSGGDRLLQMARNIAACHHDRWDGKGYPGGVAGEEIPLEARIVSVADVYDALTSRRVYKPAMPHAQALEIISQGRGTQFDPQVVDALIQSAIVFQESGLLLHSDDPTQPM
ncbi:MAG: HD domain-containing protein [Phycisphaerales bacterium]|nr:HD domain-containing protein [Phycisphaerales bacterium]